MPSICTAAHNIGASRAEILDAFTSKFGKQTVSINAPVRFWSSWNKHYTATLEYYEFIELQQAASETSPCSTLVLRCHRRMSPGCSSGVRIRYTPYMKATRESLIWSCARTRSPLRKNSGREPEAASSRQASNSDSRPLVRSGLASRTRLPTFRRVATGWEAREAVAEVAAEAAGPGGWWAGVAEATSKTLRDRNYLLLCIFFLTV